MDLMRAESILPSLRGVNGVSDEAIFLDCADSISHG
jgi:hypothetical protein